MKHVEIFHDYGPVDKSLINDFEKSIGYKLPEFYKKLLSQHNALCPERCNFDFFDKEIERVASRDVNFLGYGPEVPESSNIASLQWHDVYGRDHVVVFGKTAGGDYVCFDYSSNSSASNPTISVMFHDYFGDDGRMLIVPVADDFEKFMDSLYSDDE